MRLGQAKGYPRILTHQLFALADTPGMTGRAIAAALQTSHETIANFVLAATDRDQLLLTF